MVYFELVFIVFFFLKQTNKKVATKIPCHLAENDVTGQLKSWSTSRIYDYNKISPLTYLLVNPDCQDPYLHLNKQSKCANLLD